MSSHSNHRLSRILRSLPAEPERLPRQSLQMGPTRGVYPAADALAAIGDPAVPALERTLRNPDEKKIARINAALTLFFIRYRRANDLEVIRMVLEAAKSSSDPDTANGLRQLAVQMSSRCSAEKKRGCQDLVKSE